MHTIDRCRLCSSKELISLYSLGEQYVSTFLREGEKPQHRCPIDMVLCDNCTLVQLRHSAPQELLYSNHYWYKSGITNYMRQHLAEAAKELAGLCNPGDIVLDIGSNDGTLLRAYPPSLRRIGVEPANNLVDEGRTGIDLLIHGFWNAETFLQATGGRKARIITAFGMFYDLEDPGTFIRDVAQALAPDGTFVAQIMCLWDMMEARDVGNMSHEHLEFYSLKSLRYLLSKHGLCVASMSWNETNGGSYRFYIKHGNEWSAGFNHREYMESILEYHKPATHWRFYEDICRNRKEVREFVAPLDAVWVYGASTKGNVLLQWYDLPNLVAAADRAPYKHGLYTPTGLRIYDEDTARLQARYFLALPYAFRDEFLEREKAWRAAGGKFIFPLPELECVP